MHKRKNSKKNSKKTVASVGESSKKKKEKQSKNCGASGRSSDSKFNSKKQSASGESPESKSKCIADFRKWIPDSEMFDSVNFGFLKLGSLCNASENNAFSSAYCNITQIRNAKKGHYSLNIKKIFSVGFELIDKIRTNKEKLNYKSNLAKQKLRYFFEKKGKS